MKHATANREDWLEARMALLRAEKDLTHASDEIARRRRELPWVKVDRDYRFDTQEGEKSLKDLFDGRSQLLVYHFMFGPDYKAGCTSCSFIADGFNGIAPHLSNHDVSFWAVSRAPVDKLLEFRERMGWSFPWASSFDREFNHDFSVRVTPAEQDNGYNYNFEEKPALPKDTPTEPGGFSAATGVGLRTYLQELPGMSAFAIQDGDVYHTYSTYARGLDGLWGGLQWLDRAPLGRNEVDGPWWKHRDSYAAL